MEIVSIRRSAVALMACTGLVVGLGAASPQLAAASTGRPGGTSRPGAAARAPLGTAQQRELLRLYAAYRHIPVRDIAGVIPGSVRLVHLSGTGAQWASAAFLPSRRAPLAVRVGFQDGAGSGIFTRAHGGGWKVAGLAGEPFGCGVALPASVRRTWHLARCQGGAAPPRAVSPSFATGTTGDLAAIALAQVGVSDNPSESGFGGLDCDPYTTLVDVGASSTGCGETSNEPYFGLTQDESEEWCADLAKWVWKTAGVTSDLSTLTPAASSFYLWGQEHGESMPKDPADPQVGDAVEFYSDSVGPASDADHVGIITGVDQDGNVNMVNGDFAGGPDISVQYNPDEDLTTFATDIWGSGTDWTFISPQLSVYNPPDSPSGPAVWDNTNGHLEVYGRGAGSDKNDLMEDYWASGSGWTGLAPVGGSAISSDPTAIYDTASGNLEVYATGTNGQLQESWWDPTNDWQYQSLGGDITGSPTAVYNPVSGNLEVYAIGAAGSPDAGQLVETYWHPGSGWSAWKGLGGDLTGSPCAVYDAINSHLEVYARSTSGDLWEAWWISGTGWQTQDLTAATTNGGPISGSPSAVYDPAGGNLEVYATAASTDANQLEEYYWNSTYSWRSQYLGGAITDSPSAVYDPIDSALEVYAQANTSSGSGGQLEEDYWKSGSGWSGWGSPASGSSLDSSPYALYNATANHLEIYARAPGTGSNPDTLWQAWWYGTGWDSQNLGGALTGL
jgi:hypothetical protein